MGCGEMEDLEVAPMDLYTRVKLRTKSAKRCNSNSGYLLHGNVESANKKPSKSKWIRSRSESTSNTGAIKCDGLMWLLEAMKSDTQNQIVEKSGKGIRVAECVAMEGTDSLDFSAEGTAIEMLRALSKARSKKLSLGFNFGELVWGKIGSHPWWPGQIYDESLASLSAPLTKQKGCVLVAFFGDNTYGWLDSKHVVPFEHHFDEKWKQSHDRLFLKAIEEALSEVKKRYIFGLTCKCCNNSTLMYSVEEIEKARNDFEPREMFYFLRDLALRPNVPPQEDINWIRNEASVLAYQKAASVKNEYPADISYEKKKAHRGQIPLEESKHVAKQVKLKVPKAKIQGNSWRKNALQKRSLHHISSPQSRLRL